MIIGSFFVGVVNNIGVDYVGCLIYNCFNVFVLKLNFRNGLFYDSLDIGFEFIFIVIGIEVVNGVLVIIGEVGEYKKWWEFIECYFLVMFFLKIINFFK